MCKCGQCVCLCSVCTDCICVHLCVCASICMGLRLLGVCEHVSAYVLWRFGLGQPPAGVEACSWVPGRWGLGRRWEWQSAKSREEGAGADRAVLGPD